MTFMYMSGNIDCLVYCLHELRRSQPVPEYNLIDLLLQAGAIAWFCTVIVLKDGPWKLLAKFRLLMDKLWGGKDKNPFRCTTCASFWIGILIVTLYEPQLGLQRIIGIFGLMGIALAIRGLSQDFG